MARRFLKGYSSRRIAAAALVALGLLPLTMQKGLSSFVDRASPSAALKIDSSNPVAHSRMALRAVMIDPENADFERAELHALSALPGIPHDSTSLAMLGFAAEVRGDDPDIYLDQAARFSKRSLPVHLFKTLEALQNGDPKGASDALDLALTTSPESQEFLFPYVYQLMATADGRREFIAKLNADVSWKRPFWMAVSSARPVPDFVVPLVEEIGNRQDAKIAGIEQRLVKALASSGQFEDAVRVGALAQEPLTLISGGGDLLDAPSELPFEPFDWQLANSARLSSDLTERGLLIVARSAREGTAATRVIRLGQGVWRLSGTVTSDNRGGDLAISMSCATTNGARQTRSISLEEDQETGFDLDWAIPSDCAFQQIRIDFDASGVSRTTVNLSELTISPAGQR